MLGISPKNPYALLGYLGGLHSHVRNPFNPMIVDEACVQEQYLENLGQTKGKPSVSKKKEH
jgi:hypothetical protein